MLSDLPIFGWFHSPKPCLSTMSCVAASKFVELKIIALKNGLFRLMIFCQWCTHERSLKCTESWEFRQNSRNNDDPRSQDNFFFPIITNMYIFILIVNFTNFFCISEYWPHAYWKNKWVNNGNLIKLVDMKIHYMWPPSCHVINCIMALVVKLIPS